MPAASKNVPHSVAFRPRPAPRRAFAMAAVLVCLLVIMLISGTLVRGMMLRHRQANSEARQLQALWLAESAAALAVSQLRADPGYTGEVWRPVVDDHLGAAATTEIAVQRVDAQAGQYVIQIKAIWPEDPVQRVVLERKLVMTLPPAGDNE